jgi:hypothetical protein
LRISPRYLGSSEQYPATPFLIVKSALNQSAEFAPANSEPATSTQATSATNPVIQFRNIAKNAEAATSIPTNTPPQSLDPRRHAIIPM